MLSQLASEAMIRNPRLAAFKPLIGVWTTVGRHSMIPGITLHGQTAFEWHEGGAFLRMRSEIEEPGIPSAMSLRYRRGATPSVASERCGKTAPRELSYTRVK
jgi:hypothetical protein